MTRPKSHFVRTKDLFGQLNYHDVPGGILFISDEPSKMFHLENHGETEDRMGDACKSCVSD